MEQGKKYDSDKPEYGLIPPMALLEVAKVLTYGSKKYSPDNWKYVKPKIRYFNAVMRHCWSWLSGEKYDPETGLHHLAHAITSLLFLIEHDTTYSKDDDNFGNKLTQKENI